ncbi:peptidase C14 caspase catalytic subunit p20 [Kitasatospora aureofaciens]|nr:hypothetical protein [Kitasatospora aureofaciens]ARF81989.1 hypothetical protein B6264_26680 [Kitasatospora aureofaciens]OEV34646.1 hypothetical protein HS99_0009110 [Kitasatospora aureofaciens]
MNGSVYLRREELRDSGLVGTVALGTYDNPEGLLDRQHVETARDRFTAACMRLGFSRAMKLERSGTRQDVLAGVREFLAKQAARKILYWTGHGHDTGREYVLGCRDSYPHGPEPDVDRAVKFIELLGICADHSATDLLIVVDACESQSTLSGIRPLVESLRYRDNTASRALAGRERGLVIAATAGAGRRMEEGLWVDWLEQAIGDPDLELADLVRPFDSTALYVPMWYLLEAIDRRAEASGLDDVELRPAAAELRSLDPRFFHNPYFEERGVVLRTAAMPPDLEPWLNADHFGPVADGTPLHHFSGRVRPLSRLVTWLESQTQGLLAVTGPAGIGKTALLARLALLSVPRIREGLRPTPLPQTCPRPGSVHAALSCERQSLHSMARAVLTALAPLGARTPAAGAVTPEQCIREVRELVAQVGGLNLLVDSLDEAMPGQAHEIARGLLNPLSHVAGVKLVVSTRPYPRHALDDATQESLFDALDRSAPNLELDRDRDTERDITELVETILATEAGSPYAGPDASATRQETAADVAAQCGRRFLVARLLARALARRAGPLRGRELEEFIQHGGRELHRRVQEELDVLDPGGRLRAAELLLPLALVQGTGLADHQLWLQLANALRRPRTAKLHPQALETVLARAEGALVLRERWHGAVVHRLDHAGYATALLDRAQLSPARAHRRILDELRSRVQDDWSRADTYTLTYLGTHAAQARTDPDGPPDEVDPLKELFDDPCFLVRTDPDVMLPLTAPLLGTCGGAALYRRLGGRFRIHQEDLAQRRAMLTAEAFASDPEIFHALAEIDEFAGQGWKEVWTDRGPDPLELSLPAPLGGARALSWSMADPGSIAVAGRGEITHRDADTGRYRLTRRTEDDSHVRRAVLSDVHELATAAGRVTIAHDGSSLHFWTGAERSPRLTYRWGGRLDSLTAATCGDDVQVVAADGRCAWAWRWPSRRGMSAEVRSDVLPIRPSRVALLALPDRSFLLAASKDVVLHELHGKPHGNDPLLRREWQLRTNGRSVFAAATLADGPEQGWLAVADGNAVKVWRLSVSGYTAVPVIESVPPIRSGARELALGHYGELPLIALHEGSTVRVFGITDTSFACSFELSNQRSGLAFDPLRSGRLAIGDGSEVRLLDVPTAVRQDRTVRRHDHDLRPAVGLAAARRGAPALLTRVWDNDIVLSRQAPRGGRGGTEIGFQAENRVTAVSALWSDDHWTVAAASGRRVQLWRLSEDLTCHRPDGQVDIGGDAGEPVPSLSLVAGTDGPQLFVPAGQQVLRFVRSGGTWLEHGSVSAAVMKIRSAAARTVEDRTWVLADCGQDLRLWESTASGFVALGRRDVVVDRPPGAVLGMRYADGEYLPLAAWTQGASVYLAQCQDGDWTTRSFRSKHGAPMALAFSGPSRQPLLLAFGGKVTVAVLDVAREDWCHELAVPHRGLEVETADAIYDTAVGITVVLRGRSGCDQILIPERQLRSALRKAGTR